MSILHRYMAKTIVLACAAVSLTVLGLDFLICLLGELKDVGTGDYGFYQSLGHVLLKLPHDLYQFFPMLILLGGVLGLGILSSHHELIVMRASGVSVSRIVRAVISAAFILILLATLVGECVGPRFYYLALKHKESAQNGGQAIATASGVWIHEGNNFLHIDRMIGKHHLEGVRRFEFDDQHRLMAAYFAKALDFKDGEWRVRDLVKTSFKSEKTHSQIFPVGSWDLALNPNLLNVGMVGPEELSLPKVANHAKYLIENGLQANQFQFEFWKRIFQPLTTLVMILLSVPFVFGSPRGGTMSLRIMFGVIVGFTFYILNALLGQFSIVFQMSPWLAALLPTILFACGGYLLVLKMNK